ncbi:ATP-dependent RNA helicase DRS1 [Leucoagaricus sp. SymC.cos]|nr:ATP-dependent RNA helicase DRS1 [Leucoagaricus sp. SymC.cos]
MTEDFIMTIDSDEEGFSLKTGTGIDQDDTKLDPEFVFDLAEDPYLDYRNNALTEDLVKSGLKPALISVEDIIARRRLSSKRKRLDEEEDEEDHGDGSIGGIDEEESGSMDEAFESSEDSMSSVHSDSDPLGTSDEENDSEDDDKETDDEATSSDESGSEHETQAERERKAAYFDQETSTSEGQQHSFLSMNLSRPILKALTSLGFDKPTPIQATTIPVALLGKDIVGSAVTGSGKTAAYTIPMIERLLYRERGRKAAATRCLVLVPTRELAVQCYDVGTKLSSHTDIRFCLVVGGLSLKSQEATLRTRPDVVIATPGRLIDHIRNSPSFSLDALDILVLDEADRMLSEGFADELTEIIRSCPQSRQTMLFSATMTDSVDELIRMSLNKPARLFVDPKRTTARGLVQEFVRVRAGKEAERSAMLVTLCKRTFKHRVIVFLRSKKLAHQIRIVFGLLGMNCEELHGDLSQEQRLKALQLFRDGAVDFLMATDLAARGLDIKGVETVINYDMPTQLAQYLHRVGRTARAGNQGRSVTLVGESDRKMLKAAIKHAAAEDQVRHRMLPAEAVQHWSDKLVELKDEISGVLREEKEEKQLRQAEMELRKGQNMVEHQDEIFSRPARTWFQTGKEKQNARAISKHEHESGARSSKQPKTLDANKHKRDKHSGLTRKAKRRKLAMEADKEMGDSRTINTTIRSAKKASRPTRIGLPEPVKSRQKGAAKHSRSSFDTDLPSSRALRKSKQDFSKSKRSEKSR